MLICLCLSVRMHVRCKWVLKFYAPIPCCPPLRLICHLCCWHGHLVLIMKRNAPPSPQRLLSFFLLLAPSLSSPCLLLQPCRRRTVQRWRLWQLIFTKYHISETALLAIDFFFFFPLIPAECHPLTQRNKPFEYYTAHCCFIRGPENCCETQLWGFSVFKVKDFAIFFPVVLIQIGLFLVYSGTLRNSWSFSHSLPKYTPASYLFLLSGCHIFCFFWGGFVSVNEQLPGFHPYSSSIVKATHLNLPKVVGWTGICFHKIGFSQLFIGINTGDVISWLSRVSASIRFYKLRH